jgi:hypothetical protein
MARNIIGVIVGYVAMAAFIFISFTILYLILGTEGSFQPGSFEVSTTWLILSIVLGFIAAVVGGYVCVLIAKNKKAAMWLAGIVFVLGIILAIPQFNDEKADLVREGELSNTEAMENAVQPEISLILNPILGALGVLAGSKMKGY